MLLGELAQTRTLLPAAFFPTGAPALLMFDAPAFLASDAPAFADQPLFPFP